MRRTLQVAVWGWILPALLAVAGGVRGAQPGVPGMTASTAGLAGCQGPCLCKWRVSFSEGDSGFAEPMSSGSGDSRWRRAQHCPRGRPALDMTVRDCAPGVNLCPAAASTGFLRIRLEHIDTCSECADNAVIAGWSKPELEFTGNTQGAAAYYSSTRLQAVFSVLAGANNMVEAVETGDSQGYGASISFTASRTGAPGGAPLSGGASVTLTMPTQTTSPSGRLHAAPWRAQMKLATEELLTLTGMQSSSGSADGNPVLCDAAAARALVRNATHNAGLSFACKCGSGSHPLPPPGGGGVSKPPGGSTGAGGSGPVSVPVETPHCGGEALADPPRVVPACGGAAGGGE